MNQNECKWITMKPTGSWQLGRAMDEQVSDLKRRNDRCPEWIGSRDRQRTRRQDPAGNLAAWAVSPAMCSRVHFAALASVSAFCLTRLSTYHFFLILRTNRGSTQRSAPIERALTRRPANAECSGGGHFYRRSPSSYSSWGTPMPRKPVPIANLY